MFNILNVSNVKGVCMPSVCVCVCVSKILYFYITMYYYGSNQITGHYYGCCLYHIITNTILIFCIINTFL